MQHILDLLETQGYRRGGNVIRFDGGGEGGGEGPGGMGRGGGMGGGGMGGGEGGVGAGSGPSGGSAEGTAARAGMGFGGTGSGIGGDNSAGSGNNSVGLSDISSMLNSISPLAAVIPAVRAPMALANAAISAISAISSVASGEVSVGDAISKLTRDGLMGFISKETGLSAAAISSAMNGDLGDAAKAQATASLTKALNKAGLGAANAAIGAISRAGNSGTGSSGPSGSDGGNSRTSADIITALAGSQSPALSNIVQGAANTGTATPQNPTAALLSYLNPNINADAKQANTELSDQYNFSNPDILAPVLRKPTVKSAEIDPALRRLLGG